MDSFIARTASGQPTNERMWYGTAASNCNNWTRGVNATGVFGSSHMTARARLSWFGAAGCGSSLPVICLEQ